MIFSNPLFSAKSSILNRSIMLSLSVMMMVLYGLVWTKTPLEGFNASQNIKSNGLTLGSIDHTPFDELLASADMVANSVSKELEFPRFSPVRFSAQLVQIKDIQSRKKTFVNNLLPAILASNEVIKADRRYVLMLKKTKDSGQPLTSKQQDWLKQIASRYKLQRVTIAELLKRVDVIPPSLALGQAVVETGWGGSLAAQRLNSPFGMMKSRDRGFAYDNLQESVGHYIHNLNTHEAYSKMRTIRATLRNTGDTLCSMQLAEGLIHYSELGKTYVSRVKNIIHSFDLRYYDQALLAKMPNTQQS